MVGGAISEKKRERRNSLCHRTKEHRLLLGVSIYAAAEDAVTVRCESGRAP